MLFNFFVTLLLLSNNILIDIINEINIGIYVFIDLC